MALMRIRGMECNASSGYAEAFHGCSCALSVLTATEFWRYPEPGYIFGGRDIKIRYLQAALEPASSVVQHDR